MLDTPSPAVLHPLTGLRRYLQKLERRSALSTADREVLLCLKSETRTYKHGDVVVSADTPSSHTVLLETGILSRQKRIGKQSCQILAVHIPGDAVDLQSVLFVNSDHDIKSHGNSVTQWIKHQDILRVCEARPVLWRAIWLDTLVDAAIFREWTANIGQRSAPHRIAHLALELAARFEAIEDYSNDTIYLPLTQQDLANALGLSLVHLNKSLRTLREANLLHHKGKSFEFLNRSALRKFAAFSDEYLHLDGSRTNDLILDN